MATKIDVQQYTPGEPSGGSHAREGKGSILKPFTALKFLGEKPDTLDVPRTCRAAADRYRGFHVNDLDACIGCGTCAEICDNDAIRMVPVEGRKAESGRTQYRPAIDYGRCCWCALCVDVCTTNSLNMTTEYIHVDPDPNTFFILPDEYGIHKESYPLGWQADEQINLLDLKRVDMEELKPEERSDSFVEIVQGFSREQAEKEASRCVGCGICTQTCPAAMNIPEYINAIWEGDIAEAGRQMYKTNPLPDICGRICTHKCEGACSIGVRGEPISIRWLKRYAMDSIPVEDLPVLVENRVVKPGNSSVGIIGSGPAGLSAAYYLVLMGYRVTIFESYPEPGGMMRYGIPEYRLPYDVIDKDVKLITELGVEIRYNTRVGEDITMEELRNDFDVVLMASGFHAGRSTRVPGTDHPMVFQAIDLLSRTTRDEDFPIEKKIVVIGGGNVAMDIARTLARKQRQKYGQVDLVVTSLESRDIMPADEEEIIESGEEGIVFHPGRGPEEILVEGDRLLGLRTSRCIRVFNNEGRFAPEFNKEDVETYEATMVVEAIGQAPDMGYLGSIAEELEYDGRRIKVDGYFQASLPWLFVVGDIIKGPDVINAIETGHRAALGVDYYLSHRQPDEIGRIDEILRFARDFEQRESTIVESVLRNAKGDDALRTAAEFVEDTVRDALDKIDALLSNRNSRIHLRQELTRVQRRRDFQSILELVAPEDGADAESLRRSLVAHRRAAMGLYTDILHLNKNKELDFVVEVLRDRAETAVNTLEEGVAAPV